MLTLPWFVALLADSSFDLRPLNCDDVVLRKISDLNKFLVGDHSPQRQQPEYGSLACMAIHTTDHG